MSEREWDFFEAEAMEKPWEYWDNSYTRYRKLQWEIANENQDI